MPPNDNLPRVVLGTMTFGAEVKHDLSVTRVGGAENVEPFLQLFHSHGHVEIDTARVYGSGSTEKVLGELPTAHLKISTKAWPFEGGSFNKENLAAQLRQSLKTLNATKVDIFYLHAPESSTPLDVTAKAINDLYKEGLFERFGLSNFFSWQVASMYEICKQNDYVLPTVCQAMYNPVSRSVVTELLPCLKQFNISFYAYHPVAGGLLTGKYKFDKGVTEEGQRFDPKTGSGKHFRDRFWNQLTFDGLDILEKAAAKKQITLLEATLRWMRHHGGLDAKDGIIIGASSLKNLEENLNDLDKGPLDQSMVEAFDEAWEKIKPVSQYYAKHQTLKFPPHVVKLFMGQM
ncbi:aflatoxin B1 aldehyde reductase [Entomortierella parvispora]|uniref:Aflatoxin B1 aldehyde reductase n=1 Tax=Entomortierella parvispora TaxID=205924 RepID=A0A9P3LPP8_9FUNG|nr:aflatoxin B1 aldehyde reductase [Entomortierella parvispora]